MGLDTIGFTDCKKFDELRTFFQDRKNRKVENEFEEVDIEKRINPKFYMEDGKTIISIAFPYNYGIHSNNKPYFSMYTLGADYHKVVTKYLQMIGTYIEGFGGKVKYFVDSNALPERYIANKAGIGFIGKNNMLITEKYGSFVFLGEIITNLYIKPDIKMQSKCNACLKCIESCPSKAINLYNTNANICLSYITQKKHLDDFWLNKLEGRLFGCDTCQIVCPFNKDISISLLKEFKPMDYMKQVNEKELININNEIFNEKYKNTSCGWRGKNILQRNAMINVFYQKTNVIIEEQRIKSPYVKDYYYRLLRLFNL